MTQPTFSAIAPELDTNAEQIGLSADSLVEGEAIIDLNLAAGVDYDVDDLGDGQLVVQYWRADDAEESDA